MSTYANSFRGLIVWKQACDMTLYIYELTKKFPPEEKYAMTSQLRRASSSVMANIAEGNERNSRSDCMRFLEISRGSLVEVDCFIELARKLTYLSESEYKSCLERISKTAYLLNQFKNSQAINPRRS